ncbi:MAG TPA: oligosaccharide flippase family protein [Pyrinomonadaceae bacterium]|nr:oligosaccharide flippase family protein [Pyrinomonadaceae bacterium]
MTRTRRFIGGAGFGYANQAMVTVAGLWLTPFLLTRTGQQDYGLWLVCTQALAYLTLMDFGVVALLPRETAYALGRAGGAVKGDELPLVVGQTARLVLWQTPLVAAASLAFWLLVPAEWGPLSRPLALVLLTFTLTFPLRIFQAVLLGLQDLEFLAKAQACSWLLSTALTVALVAAGFGLYALAGGWVAAQALVFGLTLVRVRRRYPEALPRSLPRLTREGARRRLAGGFWVSVSQIASVLLSGTDLIIVGKLLGPAAVVPYACTGKLVAVFSNQPQMLSQLAIPALSEIRAGAPREHLAHVCLALSHAVLLLSGAVVCVVMVVNRGFVGWWVGSGQYGGFTLTLLVLLLMVLRHWNMTLGVMIFSFGGERRLAVVGLLDGVVTLVSAVALTRWLGFVGAPLGSIVGVCVVGLPCNVAGLAASGALPVARLLRSLAPWFWRFALLALGACLLARRFVPDTFATLAAASLVAATAYALVMLPVAWREPLGSYVRPRVAPLLLRFSRALQRGAA